MSRYFFNFCFVLFFGCITESILNLNHIDTQVNFLRYECSCMVLIYGFEWYKKINLSNTHTVLVYKICCETFNIIYTHNVIKKREYGFAMRGFVLIWHLKNNYVKLLVSFILAWNFIVFPLSFSKFYLLDCNMHYPSPITTQR